MALTRNSISNILSKAFSRSPPSSVFICRHVWKGGDVVTEDNEQTGSKSNGETGGGGRYNEASKSSEKMKETKERATETAQEGWRAIEEAAADMKQRVVPNIETENQERYTKGG